MADTPPSTTDGPATPAPDNQAQEERRFTQADIDKVISERLERERRVADERRKQDIADAIAEEKRKSQLSAEQLAAEESKKLSDELAKREKEISIRENRAEAREILQDKGISSDLVDFVVDVDIAKTKENIKILEKAWSKAVEAGVADKMKGTTPTDKSTTATATVKPKVGLMTF